MWTATDGWQSDGTEMWARSGKFKNVPHSSIQNAWFYPVKNPWQIDGTVSAVNCSLPSLSICFLGIFLISYSELQASLPPFLIISCFFPCFFLTSLLSFHLSLCHLFHPHTYSSSCTRRQAGQCSRCSWRSAPAKHNSVVSLLGMKQNATARNRTEHSRDEGSVEQRGHHTHLSHWVHVRNIANCCTL